MSPPFLLKHIFTQLVHLDALCELKTSSLQRAMHFGVILNLFCFSSFEGTRITGVHALLLFFVVISFMTYISSLHLISLILLSITMVNFTSIIISRSVSHPLLVCKAKLPVAHELRACMHCSFLCRHFFHDIHLIIASHQPYLTVYHGGKLYIDHNILFGLSSATGLQGEVACAIVDIWCSFDVKPTNKWVDDVYIWRFPSAQGIYLGISNGHVWRYDYDLSKAKSLVAEGNVPWHGGKGQPLMDDGEYVGFFWDVPNKCATLVERKRRKYVGRLADFNSRFQHSRVPLRELQRISGCLTHAAFIYPHGRSYLSNLYSAIASYPNEHSPRFLRPSVISDLVWWLMLLQADQPPLDLSPRPLARDYGIWVDASTGTGVGLLWNGHWAAWSTSPQWRGQSRDIGWLEAVAVELAVRLAYSKGITDSDILI